MKKNTDQHPAGMRREDERRSLEADLLVGVQRELRSVYAEILHQPLPERIARLIERLEAEISKTRSG